MITLFGLSDPFIWMSYVLAIGLTGVCILYGLLSGRNGHATADQANSAHDSEDNKHIDAIQEVPNNGE